MDFEKLYPGCAVQAMSVTISDGQFVRLLAYKDEGKWALTDYAKTLANVSTDKVESPKKQAKKPVPQAAPELDDLDI